MNFDKSKIDYTLYLCTDRELMSCKTIEESVEQGIKGGCSIVQLREKDCSSREFFELALNVKKITQKYNVPLIINDRVDIALLAKADGVHLGQSDLPCSEVRKLAGDNFIIGVSAATTEEAVKAQSDGADYLGIGAMYQTSTKTDTRPVTLEGLKEICSAVNIPIVAIGGINKNTIPDFSGMDINGFAVISAIVSKENITQAAAEIRELIMQTLPKSK